MHTRLMLPIGLAILLVLGLCTALAGRAAFATDYTLATADGLSLALSADGQITSLQIDGSELVSAPGPALWLRDLSDASTVITPNLVANLGFEDGLAGWMQDANSGLEVNVVVSPTHSGDVENAVVSAMQLNGEYLIAVTPQDTTKRVSFTVHTGQSSDRHILYDLRHGTQQSYPSGGTVRVTASPGEGTVYRMVPTPPASQCVGDANGNGIGDIVDIQAMAAKPGCVQYLPIVVANWHRPQNLLRNPGFEQGFDDWSPGHYPPGSSGNEMIVSEGCRHDQCLKMQHNDSTWQGTSQSVGSLAPGGVYQLSAWFKTAAEHYGFINLHDPYWKDADCRVAKRSLTVQLQGDGDWRYLQERIRIPETDDCGESTASHTWRVFLYGYHPVADNSAIYYDDVSLIHLTDFAPPAIYTELEELDGWQTQCQRFSDGMPPMPCPAGFVTEDPVTKVSGAFARVLHGDREQQTAYVLALPVKPNTTYRVAFSLKIADRVVYNYLNLPYPHGWTQQRPGLRDAVEGTKGIWSGRYMFEVDGVDLLPGSAKDAEYRSPSDVDWFHEEHYFQTGPDQVEAILRVRQQGFDGKLYLDGITVQEVDSAIADHYFHIPLTTPFKGMRIVAVSQKPLQVQTNAARFAFTANAIEMTHNQGYTATLTFPAGFLQDLQMTEEVGNVFLENKHLMLSIGADSVLLGKFKPAQGEDASGIELQGPRPAYHSFEAGVLFATDYSSGILFAPLRPKHKVVSMPYQYDSARVRYSYPDALFQAVGLQTWHLLTGFQQPVWRVAYDFRGGEGFIAQPFPPKSFDRDAYCRERMASVSANMIQNPSADFSYSLQKLRERANIALVWMNKYAQSQNDLNPPEFYCKNDAGLFVHCDDPSASHRYPVGYKFDVSGPYTVGEPEAFHRFVAMAHAQGMKVVIYMSPNYYYTSDVDAFLGNLNDLLEEYNLDGVYYDGVYGGDVLRSLELVRRTRDLLGDRFYAQHISWERSLTRRSDRYRAPFLDDMADLIWNGEGVKRGDDDTWRLNYCGQNVSNTPSTLLAELRPVDYSADADTSVALSLSPLEQISKTLAYNGTFMTSPYAPISTIHDKHFGRSIPFDTDAFWQPYNNICLGQTCGDGICDVGETYETCLSDCAPITPEATFSRQGETYMCKTAHSVAQWLLDGAPFYTLHFTFDTALARDDSVHRMNPNQAMGVSVRPPTPVFVDGRRAFAFDGAARLYGNTSAALDLAGKDFSLFAAVKVTETVSGEQTIMALDAGGNVRLGLSDGRLFVAGDVVHTPATATVVSEGCLRGQCLRMQHNDATWQGVRLQVGQLAPGEVYTLTASFKTTSGHDGYINLYDRSWGRGCGGNGRSFTALAGGADQWQSLSVQVTIPVADECGDNTADDDWWVYLYGHHPVTDNSPVYYDEVVLTHDGANLLRNPSFEEGLGPWLPGSYRPPDQVVGAQVLTPGAWHTVGMVYQRPTLRLYVDGEQEAEATIDLIDFEGYGVYTIGAPSTTASSGLFRGYLDDLFLADRALTPAQIQQYHATLHKTLTLPGASEATCVVVLEDGGYARARESGP